MSLLCDGEEGLAALCEGVGGETCYPATHRLRRAGRGFCGEPQQVGDAGEITIVSSSARRALQASLIFGAPRLGRSPPPSVFGKHNRSHVSELSLATTRRGAAVVGHEGDELRGEPLPGAAPDPEKDEKSPLGHELGCGVGVLEGQRGAADGPPAPTRATSTSFWGRFRSRLQRGACCSEPRDPSHEPPKECAR